MPQPPSPLRRARLLRGYRLYDVSEQTGVSMSRLSMAERGEAELPPAKDVLGAHGKTFLMVGFDEIHGYRTWDLLEALSPDPTRTDALTWITSYATLYNSAEVPLNALCKTGREDSDPRMFFSWYAADFTTDPELADAATGEERANPSMRSWGHTEYLPQQKRRLPTSKYRRLHLNLPGSPDGAFLDADSLAACVVPGRRRLPPQEGIVYRAFIDMSGGSSDDAVLSIAHERDGCAVLDLVEKQAGRPPFDPRKAVDKFAGILTEYRCATVEGDKYAGETFLCDFEARAISYRIAPLTKSDLYEAPEPVVNAREVELLDDPTLLDQLLTLVWRGRKVDHEPGQHDDHANAAAGAVRLVVGRSRGVSPAQLYEPGGFFFDERGAPRP